ncbi:MAG: RHS repeat-associated core domain-containing protein [Acidobacteriota bacterium]
MFCEEQAAALKFTSKERDAESNLDYFGARYISGAQGRFTSTDPVAGSIFNPQSLNLYASPGTVRCAIPIRPGWS